MTPRALVVDDEPQMLSIVSFALETQGFECLSVANTARAWEHLAAHNVNPLVLDIMTPTGSGIDLVKRNRARGDDVPIILLTALGDEEDRIAGLEAGADDYVTKPFSPPRVSGAPRPQRLSEYWTRANCISTWIGAPPHGRANPSP